MTATSSACWISVSWWGTFCRSSCSLAKDVEGAVESRCLAGRGLWSETDSRALQATKIGGGV